MDRPPASNPLGLARPRFDCLPLELRIYHIYVILPISTLARCRAVSRHWRAVVDEALEKAHPYQRAFALRELYTLTASQRGLPSELPTARTGCLADTNQPPMPGFPLLSLDTWETAFYDLGISQ